MTLRSHLLASPSPDPCHTSVRTCQAVSECNALTQSRGKRGDGGEVCVLAEWEERRGAGGRAC
eukprot:2554417-Rhodomonas_salina.1